MFTLFAEGFLIGLVVCMPMGAIGMLCLRYILLQGKVSGVAAGLGIALADSIAAFIAALGLTAITLFIKAHEIWMHTIGSFILLGFGLFLILTKKTKANRYIEKGLAHIFLVMFMITITNPLTILSFIGIFASFGLESLENNLLAVFSLSFGVFLGSLAWWLILILATMFLKINELVVRRINEIAGSVLILGGLTSLYTVWVGY